MLKALVGFSLRFRAVVTALACVLLAYGFYVARNAKLDVFPNFVQPQVVIQTECPGLSPEQAASKWRWRLHSRRTPASPWRTWR